MNHAAVLQANPLDEAAGHNLFGGHIKELVFNGGTAGVDDKDFQSLSFSDFILTYLCCAWIAVMATVLMISSTVQPRLRSLTGLLRPWRTGPMAMAPVSLWTAL